MLKFNGVSRDKSLITNHRTGKGCCLYLYDVKLAGQVLLRLLDNRELKKRIFSFNSQLS